jgi:hypothetical protein
MTPNAFTLWRAYYQLEPWGAWRDNIHSAQIAALLFNINRGKATPPATVQDYMYEDPEVTAYRRAQTFAGKLRAMSRGKENGS